MASVSIRSLYHYFPNKEAAGGPVIDRHNNETMQLYGNRWLGWRCSQSRRYANSSSSDRRPSRQSEGTPRAGGSRWPSARLVPVRHATTARLAGNDRLATTDAEHGRSIEWSVPELHIFRSGTGCTDLGSSNARQFVIAFADIGLQAPSRRPQTVLLFRLRGCPGDARPPHASAPPAPSRR